METIVDSIRAFIATNYRFYQSYPMMKQSFEQDSYYRTQNKSFPGYFFAFVVGVYILQISADIMLMMDGTLFSRLLHIIVQQAIIDISLLVICNYIFRIIRVLRLPANKKDPAIHAYVRRRFLLCGTFPTLLFALSPLSMPPTEKLTEACDVNWTIFIVSQLYLSAWSIGSLGYKISLMITFNVCYCGISVVRGCFAHLMFLRLSVPAGVCIIFIIALDAYMKQNFLLKRRIKQQKEIYEKFLEQIQDPILILSGSQLVFRNRASEVQLGISAQNFSSKLRDFKSAGGWSLEDVVRELIADPSQGILSDTAGVKKERYYYFGGSRLSAFGIGGKRRTTMQVTLIESPGALVEGDKDKTTSVVMHDITEELEMQERKDEEKYKHMLLFSLSHELKTPLNIFQGFLADAKKSIQTVEGKDSLRQAKGAWRYLRNKINDILDYAQILSGDFSLHVIDFSLKRFICYLRKTTSFLLGSKHKDVALEFDVNPAIPDIYSGDRDRMEQILFNFLSNAAKFTEKGRIKLSVGPSRKGLVFTVTDTGCGMTREKAESLFSLSRQPGRKSSMYLCNPALLRSPSLGAVTTKLCGLGLTISKMICVEMGVEEVSVNSEPGGGSTFSFTLPKTFAGVGATEYGGYCCEEKRRCMQQYRRRLSTQQETAYKRQRAATHDEGDDHIPDEEGDDSATANTRLSLDPIFKNPEDRYRSHCLRRELVKPKLTPTTAKRIALVVDDNDFNRYVAEEMLKKYGFETVPAENGKVAIEKLRELQSQGPVLVFMDVDMPVMDGIQATLNIRRENLQPRPNIVALTAFSAEIERKNCFEAGMDYFIDKPLTKERLYEFLQNSIGIGNNCRAMKKTASENDF